MSTAADPRFRTRLHLHAPAPRPLPARVASDITDLRLMTAWARKLIESNHRVPTSSLSRLLELSDRVASHAEERR